MKKLLIVAGLAAVVAAAVGCSSVGNNVLRMTRTVTAAKQAETLEEMIRQIELNNRFEVDDVSQEFVSSGNVTITITARPMRQTDVLTRTVVKYQNENIKLKRRIAELESELEKAKK